MGVVVEVQAEGQFGPGTAGEIHPSVLVVLGVGHVHVRVLGAVPGQEDFVPGALQSIGQLLPDVEDYVGFPVSAALGAGVLAPVARVDDDVVDVGGQSGALRLEDQRFRVSGAGEGGRHFPVTVVAVGQRVVLDGVLRAALL